jgi:hypothetical protein
MLCNTPPSFKIVLILIFFTVFVNNISHISLCFQYKERNLFNKNKSSCKTGTIFVPRIQNNILYENLCDFGINFKVSASLRPLHTTAPIRRIPLPSV